MRVEARALRRRFGEITALDGVSFTLPEGARTALVGPNASGKSTLIRALLGLVRVEGEVRLGGRARSLATARQLAYAPQSAPPLAATVGDVLETVARLRALAPREIVATAARLALDVTALRARPLRALSGGTRQKFVLALALAPRPRLLILDEPTASLDAHTRTALATLLAELDARTSVILCSHRLEEVRSFANRVLMLEAGRVTHDGAPQNV